MGTGTPIDARPATVKRIPLVVLPPMWLRGSIVPRFDALCDSNNFVRTEDAACVIVETEGGDYVELE